MDDELAASAQRAPPPAAPPTVGTSSTTQTSRLLHPRVYTGILAGLTVLIAQPADIVDLSLRQFGHYTANGCYHLTLLDSFLLSSLSTLTFVPALPLSALLSHCCRHIVGFPALLLTYIRCTGRGWIVREGSKLGVDFLLYRQTNGGSGGVQQQKSRQHSVYAVRVIQQQQSGKDEADTSDGNSGGVRSTSLQQLSALLRVAHSTKKRLLVSTVTTPSNAVWEGDSGLAALSHCRVELCELSRWSPAAYIG